MPDTVSVLIVDDSPEKLIALESVLLELPVKIVKVGSGREALRRLLAADFAVILLDVRMPDMDGFETAALIRRRPRSAQTPIIFITAFGDETHVARGYSLRAVDYITTPVVPEVLRTKVSVFVDLFRAAAQVRRQADRLREQATQLHRLTAASLEIHSAPTIDAILDAATRSAREMFRASGASTVVRLDDRRVCRAVAGVPCTDPEAEAIGTLVARSNRAYRAPRPPGDGTETPATSDILAVPLATHDGRNMGVMQVARNMPNPFVDEDEDLLQQLARMASIAIENALFGEAREANRLKDEFIATVSHELRTPLNALRSWAWILRSGSLTDEKIGRAAEAIERNVIAQARIVDDLLDVSRIVTGKLRLSSRLLQLAPIIDTAIESIVAAAEAKGIEIRRHFAPETGGVLGDAERLQQVVWNLLSNAVKFTPTGGRVEVHLERVGADVRVRVTDNGQGIAPNFLPHVFERFRQADSSSTRSNGGLGLGLAIVRHLIELHGGVVGVASPGEGLGATFTFTLPGAAGEREVAIAHSTAAGTAVSNGEDGGPRDLTGIRVLVVEDEVDTRDALTLMMSEAGASVTAVGTAGEALAMLVGAKPDVLVCDIGLPYEDGYSLIRNVRAQENGGPSIPAVALTAYAQESDRQRALAAGYQFHMAKPVQPAKLLRLLAETAVRMSAPGAAPVTQAAAGTGAGGTAG